MIPPEIVTLVGSTVGSFILKMIAQRQADQAKALELSIKRMNAEDDSHDKASKRSNPLARKIIAIIIIGVAFLGLFIVPFFDIPVTLIQEIPRHSLLWGFIEWGKGYDVLHLTGFALPPYVRHATMMVLGYFFGGGLTKTQR